MKNKFISFFTQRRKELGYSQSKIANELGISDQAVSNWERGITFPDLSYLSDVARVLNTNVLSLITGKHKNINIKKNINFDVKRFSFYLSKLRKNKQLTQNELGKILGVSGQNISKFENGVFLPSIELLEKYVKYFNVSFLNIYYGLEDNELYENHHINTKTNRLKWVIILAVVFSILLMFIFIPTIISKKHQVTIILDEGTVLTYRIKDQGNITLPNLPTKKGYESSWDNTDTLITSDKTYRVIYTPKKYTITYQFNSSEIKDYVQEVTYGEPFVLYKPNNEEFKGYIYQSIQFNDDIYTFDHDITLVGIFNQYYQVTFVFDEETYEIQAIKENTHITLPNLPTKKGYESSWDNTDTLITSDKTYRVIYTPKKYTITYQFEDNIVEGYTQEVTYGEPFVLYKPNNEEFKGYIYQSIQFNDDIYTFDHDITLVGIFNQYYQVTFVFDEETYEIQAIKENTHITLPNLPTKKGYESSWDNTDTLITSDKTYRVIYTPKKYTITYQFNSSEIKDYVQEVTYGCSYKLYKPLGNIECEYTYLNSSIESGIYTYDYNIIIKCKIFKMYKVTIILDENNIKTQNIKENTHITLPNLPTKKGYESSWDNTDTLITSDKTYRVIYTPKKYTITYQFEDNLIEEFSQEVVYGEEFTLYAPYVNDYTFIGYIYNNEIIKNGIYEYDCDITIYGQFTKETFTIDCVFANSTHHFSQTGYGGAFTFGELQLNEFISECPYARGEYANYKISAWKDTNGNIYEVGKTYIYNFKRDIVVCPVFEYYGDAFEVEITNGKAKIIKYNISKITTLIIPDYIIINGVKYQVTEIAENTFQDIYFINISFSSNVTKIYKNTFSDEGLENNTLTKGSIYFNGTLFDWFNIDFEEAIASKKAKAYMDLYLSTFLVDSIYANNSILKIPEGVKVISSYSLANLIVREVIIPNSVHTIEAHAFKNSNISLITNIENVENVSEEAFK